MGLSHKRQRLQNILLYSFPCKYAVARNADVQFDTRLDDTSAEGKMPLSASAAIASI